MGKGGSFPQETRTETTQIESGRVEKRREFERRDAQVDSPFRAQ